MRVYAPFIWLSYALWIIFMIGGFLEPKKKGNISQKTIKILAMKFGKSEAQIKKEIESSKELEDYLKVKKDIEFYEEINGLLKKENSLKSKFKEKK